MGGHIRRSRSKSRIRSRSKTGKRTAISRAAPSVESSDYCNPIHYRSIRSRNAKSAPVQLALQLWNHFADRFRSSGTRRNDADCTGSCATEIFVRKIEDSLIVSVTMDRAHEPVHNRELVVQHFRHLGQ